jgi:hypothetical protein
MMLRVWLLCRGCALGCILLCALVAVGWQVPWNDTASFTLRVLCMQIISGRLLVTRQFVVFDPTSGQVSSRLCRGLCGLWAFLNSSGAGRRALVSPEGGHCRICG